MRDLGGELLTRTEDNVERWKEHFEDLPNPADMSSIEEAVRVRESLGQHLLSGSPVGGSHF